MRRVEGIRWANPLDQRPRGIPSHRAIKGVKGDGLRYERALAKGLGNKFMHGQWWEYCDVGGRGCCQTDFWAKAKGWVILLEVKLTWTSDAEDQLNELYVPVVAAALGMHRDHVLPVVVCKSVVGGLARPVCGTLKEALNQSKELSYPYCAVWHHAGGTPLLRPLMERSVGVWQERSLELAASPA